MWCIIIILISSYIRLFHLLKLTETIQFDRNNDTQKYIVKTMKFDHEMNDPTTAYVMDLK